MSGVSQTNRLRYRAILISREVKSVFSVVPPRFAWILERPAKWVVRRFFLRLVLRWLFLAEDGKPHRAGEVLLAELRREAGYNRKTNFSTDAQELAFREGVRTIVQWLFNYLNLNEGDVQKLMELDDGLE